jgi:2-polyprenyl-3-methyl-5-hydroxy-6-metoxy-1,4-benzoquinol methylase
MSVQKRNFKEKLNTLIAAFNIPFEEKWQKYLQDDHFNLFLYFNGLEVVDKNKFTVGKPETYKLEYNRFIHTFFLKNEYYFETKNLHNMRVVDVGCGWGILALWYALSGAKETYAIGFPHQIEFIDRLIKRGKEKRILDDSVNIISVSKPLEKNNTTIGGLAHGSVDRVYYNDVFEHLPDNIFPDSMIASYNILKKGGKLISVTHNTDNPVIFRRAEEWWTKLENESFIPYRTNNIKEKIPGIPSADLKQLVQNTRGLLTEDFNKAIDVFKATGVTHKPARLMPAVDLTIDYICENYISPPHIVSLMSAAGFYSYCYAGLMHSRRFAIFQPFAKIFKSLFIKMNSFSHTAVFVGIKQ